jgi:hypothetical protein
MAEIFKIVKECRRCPVGFRDCLGKRDIVCRVDGCLIPIKYFSEGKGEHG